MSKEEKVAKELMGGKKKYLVGVKGIYMQFYTVDAVNEEEAKELAEVEGNMMDSLEHLEDLPTLYTNVDAFPHEIP